MSGFIQFTSYDEYYNNCITHISATSQLDDWFKENNDYEVVSWQAISTGKDNNLTIVVEYKKRIYPDHS